MSRKVMSRKAVREYPFVILDFPGNWPGCLSILIRDCIRIISFSSIG